MRSQEVGPMGANRRSLYLLTVLLTGLSGCAGTSLHTPWDDALITGAVKAKLLREYGPALTRIDVDTVDRTVYLRGHVPSDTVRERAAVVALAVRPVLAVVNELAVGAP